MKMSDPTETVPTDSISPSPTLPPPEPVCPPSFMVLHPTLALILGLIAVVFLMAVIGVVFLFVCFLLMAIVNIGLRLVIPHYHSTFWIKFAVAMFVCFVWFAFLKYMQSRPS